MRVLFGVRPDLHRDFGGDTMQILRTCEHLRDLGVTVELSDALGLDPAGFDLVHLFHLTRVYETHCQLRAVRARGTVPGRRLPGADASTKSPSGTRFRSAGAANRRRGERSLP